MIEVRIDRVWKHYGTVEAVQDLTLLCPDSKMLALLGPSGCGKTSTLKMVAGIEGVTRGEIWFDELPVSQLAPGERNIAMVFEDYALYPHLTAYENIAFPLRIRGFAEAEIERRVRQVIELLGLGEMCDANVQNLSGGAQQRISIGRSLVRDPSLILFDEPLSHLDGDQKVQLRGEIKRLQKTTGLTAVLVTHDQTEALAMSDLVAVMNLGKLQQVGPPEELYARPANLFVASFIGEPPMNLLSGRLSVENDQAVCAMTGGWIVSLNSRQSHQKALDDRVIIGVRPENIALRPPEAGNGSGLTVRGCVQWKELRGDVEIVVVRLEGAAGNKSGSEIEVTVESPAPCVAAIGDLVGLVFDTSSLCLFDEATGRNLEL